MKKSITILIVFLNVFLSVAQNKTDEKGWKQGYWKKIDPTTKKIIYEGNFKDNLPQGLFKYYYPNDSIKSKMVFIQNGKIGYSTLFHPNGKMMAYGKYINELKDSTWCFYDEKGLIISKETFLLGKKNGVSTVYFSNGIISEEYHYKMDLKHGPFKQYFDKNLIKGEGNYVNGLMEGKNTYYFPNGVQVASGYYKNGQKNGPWIYKEQDGKIKEKELYKFGRLATQKETDDFFNKNKSTEEKTKTSESTPKTIKPKLSK
jgi:antitoxin component YwqK of YwqJK toxin-antitoxin module